MKIFRIVSWFFLILFCYSISTIENSHASSSSDSSEDASDIDDDLIEDDNGDDLDAPDQSSLKQDIVSETPSTPVEAHKPPPNTFPRNLEIKKTSSDPHLTNPDREGTEPTGPSEAKSSISTKPDWNQIDVHKLAQGRGV